IPSAVQKSGLLPAVYLAFVLLTIKKLLSGSFIIVIAYLNELFVNSLHCFKINIENIIFYLKNIPYLLFVIAVNSFSRINSIKIFNAFVWIGDAVMKEYCRVNGIPFILRICKSPLFISFWMAHFDNRLIPNPASIPILIGCVLPNSIFSVGVIPCC